MFDVQKRRTIYASQPHIPTGEQFTENPRDNFTRELHFAAKVTGISQSKDHSPINARNLQRPHK